MPDYRVVVARPARRELEDLPRAVLTRVWPKLEALASDPRPRGSRKIRGARNLWRLRVGDYRLVYSVDDERRLVDVIAVRHRSDVYR